jgi:beta-lactamase regulating signal transducer with metallopeptidase domain
MATRQIISSWRASATPLSIGSWRRRAWLIDRPFPVVAVVGVFRPELYVARSVAVECTPAELDAIAAHETAHIVAGDNLRRALFSLTPGARLASRLANAIEGEWSVAAEEAADAYARLSAPALDLASALTKVAGLAVGRDPEPLAGSPLIQQFALETRVRLLLDPPASSRRRLLASLPIAALFAAAILLQSAVVLSGLHELFELLVQR